MSTRKDGWLDRGGVRLHYVEWTPDGSGPDAPPALLLHGLSSNARYWDRVAGHLQDRRLIALDQRGHGLTGLPPNAPDPAGGYSMDELLDDAVHVIREMGLEKPIVVGHSWGATVSLELVGTRPGIASALVFIDGPVQSASNFFSWEEAQTVMQPPLPRYASFAEAVAESRRDLEGAWGDDLEAFVKGKLVADGDALVLTLTARIRLELLRGLYESQPDLLWSRLDVPAVALLARQSTARVARSKRLGVERLAKLAPAVHIRWFDTGHDIPLFAPAEIAAEISGISAEATSEAAAG